MKKKPKNYIRLYAQTNNNEIRVCKHIKIHGEKQDQSDYDSCEYTEKLKIFCEQCQKWYKYTIGVN